GIGGSGLNRRGFRRGFGGRNWSRRQGRLGCRDWARRRRGPASRLLPGGDASGQLQREGSELGVVLRRDDLGVILAGVEEGAARGSVALVAYRDDLGLVGFLRSVLAQGLERVGHLEDVKLQLVRRVAGGVVEGVRHALDPVLEEALGAAVDLLVEVVGVEGFDVLGSRLAWSPARWQVAQRNHGGNGL